MAWVTFMCSQINRAIDIDAQIGIHLDDSAIIPFVPVVAAPRFVSYVFDAEIFVGRQLDVRESALATCLDRKLKHSVQFVLGKHKRSPPILVPLQEWSLARKFWPQPGEDFLEMRFGKRRCNGVIKALRLFVELQMFAV